MTSWVLKNLEYIKDMLGMDSNSFYPMFISAVIGIGAFLINCFNKIKEQEERKIFELYRKSESDNFYCFVMLGEVLVFIFSVFLACFLNKIIGFCFLNKRKLAIEWEAVISGIISLGVTLFMTKMIWVRKRLLGDERGKRIILSSIFLINTGFVCELLDGRIKYMGKICMILYIIIEIMGLCHFTGRYIKYDFSSMKLHLDNGEIIVCKDIEKVVRKRDYISVEVEGKNIILQYNKIWKVEYYGDPKVILKNIWTQT